MLRNLLVITFIAVTLGIIPGCSGSGNGLVTLPSGDEYSLSAGALENNDLNNNRQLWGLWDVTIDPASGQVDIIPLRGATFTANVNNLLTLTPGNFLISDLDASNFQTEGRLDCTVTIKHPFPGLDKFNGFDVLGVFLHNGESALGYDSLTYGGGPDAGENEAVLLNADGYTRWFNQPEFDGDGIPLFEYWPGSLSNLPEPTAMLNGYKIFADGLGEEDDYYSWITTPGNADNRGWFTAGAANSRRYEFRFPIVDSSPVLDFQYAVIATWESGDPALTGQPDIYDPMDFPTSANCEEPFFLHVSTIQSDLYNDGSGSGNLGGALRADIEVFDWQGGSVGGLGVPNEINRMVIEGNFVPGGTHEFLPTELALVASAGTANSSVFQVEITDCVPQAIGETDLWVIVEAAGENGDSYDQGFPTEFPDPARRAAYLLSSVNVSGEVPSTIILTAPDGGEEWLIESHEDVTWTTTDYTGQIKLEYSKDGFVSDINEIIAATDNDGVFDWEIPDDESDTVRVRASLVDVPLIYDDSDADFSIISAGCGCEWTNPVLLDGDSRMPRANVATTGDLMAVWHKNGEGIRYSINDGTSWASPSTAYGHAPSFMHITTGDIDAQVYIGCKISHPTSPRQAIRYMDSETWEYKNNLGSGGQPAVFIPDDDSSYATCYTFSGGFEIASYSNWTDSGFPSTWADGATIYMASTNFHERDDTNHYVAYQRSSTTEYARLMRISKTSVSDREHHDIFAGETGEVVDSTAVAMDEDGTLHAVYRHFNGVNYEIGYATSTDQGDSWSTPVIVHSTTIEILKDYVGIDTNSSGFVYITYAKGSFIYMQCSTGDAWSDPDSFIDVIVPENHVTQPFPLVTSDDILHIFYIGKEKISDYGNLFVVTCE